jgi:hypothetical protein
MDEGKLLACLSAVRCDGRGPVRSPTAAATPTPSSAASCPFLSAVKTAMIALKHRKNKVGGQRIVVFVGSPVEAEAPVLKKTADALKKSNVRL